MLRVKPRLPGSCDTRVLGFHAEACLLQVAVRRSSKTASATWAASEHSQPSPHQAWLLCLVVVLIFFDEMLVLNELCHHVQFYSVVRV
jgi:hypothetical protein